MQDEGVVHTSTPGARELWLNRQLPKFSDKIVLPPLQPHATAESEFKHGGNTEIEGDSAGETAANSESGGEVSQEGDEMVVTEQEPAHAVGNSEEDPSN